MRGKKTRPAQSPSSRSDQPSSQRNDTDSWPLKMFLVPCSCGTTFAVAPDFDQKGSTWGRFLRCPNCGKRYDPRNRLLSLGYQRERYWKVDNC